MGYFWPSRVQNNFVWALFVQILGPLSPKWMEYFWPSSVKVILLMRCLSKFYYCCGPNRSRCFFFWLSRVQNNLVWELVIRILGPLRSKWMGNFWQSKVHFVLFFSPQTVEPCYFMCDFPSVAFVISIYWLRFSVQLFQQLYKSHSEHFILFLNTGTSITSKWGTLPNQLKMLGMCLCATVHRAITE